MSIDKVVELGWLKTEPVNWHELRAFQGNLKDLSKVNYERLKLTILKNRFSEPFSIWEDKKGVKHLLNGHQRLRCLFMMEQEGYQIPEKLPVNFIMADNKKQAKALVLSLASQYGEVTEDGLYEFASEAEISFDEMKETFHFPEIDFDKYEKSYTENEGEESRAGALAERFIVPPFSVLDTKQGYWQERKDRWMDVIQEKGESRKLTLSKTENLMSGINDGVSILDPVLSEVVLHWFTAPQFKVLDPFAGDTVFGFVAKSGGHEFTGIELRKEQVELNQARCDKIKGGSAKYINDTSENIDKHIKNESQDLIFSCPPYYDLEVYSDSEEDLSNQGSYEEFDALISGILKKTAKKLKNNRFAVIVISELRDKRGIYRNFVPDTIRNMQAAGLSYYNELVLLNNIGTAQMRANKYMKTRKMVRTHQNVLVFFKGDPSTIADTYPELSFEETRDS